MAKTTRVRRVKPVVGMQVMCMKGVCCEVISVAPDGATVTERNNATGNVFDFPTALLGFYMCWVP